MKIKDTLSLIICLLIPVLIFCMTISGMLCITDADSTFGIETDNPLQKLIAGKGYSDVENEVEQYIYTFTNDERAKAGLSALQYDTKLSAIAKAHSIDMGENDFFSHTNLKGQDADDRARAAGYSTYKRLSGGRYLEGIGENIFKMPYGFVSGSWYVDKYNSEQIAHEIVNGWMESSGHRANILDSSNTNIGVGVKYAKGYYYATQDFW